MFLKYSLVPFIPSLIVSIFQVYCTLKTSISLAGLSTGLRGGFQGLIHVNKWEDRSGGEEI